MSSYIALRVVITDVGHGPCPIPYPRKSTPCANVPCARVWQAPELFVAKYCRCPSTSECVLEFSWTSFWRCPLRTSLAVSRLEVLMPRVVVHSSFIWGAIKITLHMEWGLGGSYWAKRAASVMVPISVRYSRSATAAKALFRSLGSRVRFCVLHLRWECLAFFTRRILRCSSSSSWGGTAVGSSAKTSTSCLLSY
jgi:hypothetical protein